MAVLSAANGGFSFLHRYRGVQESNTDSANYPRRQYTVTQPARFSILFTCSSPTSVRIEWGNRDNAGLLVNTMTTTPLGAGSNTIYFDYTSDYDCLPENPAEPLAVRVAREKTVSVYVANAAVVTAFSVFRSEQVRYDERGLVKTQITDYDGSVQSLDNVPPLPATTLNLNVLNNLGSKNAVTFAAILAATVLCRKTLASLTTGSVSFSNTQEIPRQEHYDLSSYTGMINLMLRGSQANKITTSAANTQLETLDALQRLPDGPLDVSSLYIQPTLKTLKFGESNIGSARLTAPLQLQTARDLTALSIAYCYCTRGTVNTTLELRNAFYQCVYNLWLGRAGQTTAAKTVSMGGVSVSVATAAWPNGVLQYVVDLMDNYNYNFTYTA